MTPPDTSRAQGRAASAVREVLLLGVLSPLIDAPERVRLFFEASGAVTTPDKRVEARRFA